MEEASVSPNCSIDLAGKPDSYAGMVQDAFFASAPSLEVDGHAAVLAQQASFLKQQEPPPVNNTNC